jgi:hypothetical protein
MSCLPADLPLDATAARRSGREKRRTALCWSGAVHAEHRAGCHNDTPVNRAQDQCETLIQQRVDEMRRSEEGREVPKIAGELNIRQHCNLLRRLSVNSAEMNWLEEVERAGDRVERLRNDLPFFCEQCLKLRSKSGELIPFTLNGAQLELHRRIEEHKAKSGRVRVAVLKARQLGCSTYIAARLYHRTINNPGQRTIIVAHSRPASGNLYQIVKRFHDNMPSDMKPSVGVSNANELVFDRIDSGYSITVASDEGTGRSATAKSAALFGGSLLAVITNTVGIVATNCANQGKRDYY